MVAYEKKRGNFIDTGITNRLIDTMYSCNINDISYAENIFTRANNQRNGNYIKVRLDRFFASNNWMENFQLYSNTHLLCYSSDHNPILLQFSTNMQSCYNLNCKRKKQKFENFGQLMKTTRRLLVKFGEARLKV